jgi:hypothetical protein
MLLFNEKDFNLYIDDEFIKWHIYYKKLN